MREEIAIALGWEHDMPGEGILTEVFYNSGVQSKDFVYFFLVVVG
jgi:hypothetical protein